MPKQQAQQTDIAQKAKDLFGEETVHVIDEEWYMTSDIIVCIMKETSFYW